jgi:hypothetical protein
LDDDSVAENAATDGVMLINCIALGQSSECLRQLVHFLYVARDGLPLQLLLFLLLPL